MPPADQAAALARCIGQEFRRRMLEEYVPRIARCVDMLTEYEVWERPGRHCNGVGHLLLHLEGNVRQWIQCGVDGQFDCRDRDAEFGATPETVRASASELVDRLRATVTEAVEIVDRLDPAELLARKTYQARYEETGLAAVLHVMEHFSGHAGQIYAYTKQVRDTDLKHYDL